MTYTQFYMNNLYLLLGRSSMKQYMPKKPIRRGFKVWVVADSENGYFLDINVYVGRPSDGVSTEHGLGARVVLKLTQPFQHKNYRVFCDNFFSSPALFEELLQNGLYACGTVRSDRREFPTDLRGVRLERGSHAFRQRGSLSATIWQDKRQVYVLSTLTTPSDTVHIRRKERDGSRTDLTCPTAITTYNQHMAGVDKGDQLRQYYSLRLKFMKYYKYIFFFLSDTAITNAFILHSKFSPSRKLKHKEFRLTLVQELIGDYCGRMRLGRPRLCTSHPQSLQEPTHFPTKRSLKRKCVYCSSYRSPPRRRESRWYCSDCEGAPSLCLTGSADDDDCWRLWHSTE